MKRPPRTDCAGTWVLGLAAILCAGSNPNALHGAGKEIRGESRAVQAERSGIAPPDIFTKVALLREELELLRFEMGKPKNEKPEMEVFQVSPREVYFQAMTLFDKANRLSFENTEEFSPPPLYPVGEIRPAHVLIVVRAAMDQVLRVKKELGLLEAPAMVERDPSKTPTDVFRSIVQANRQLNLLLERRYSYADVFQKVSLAIVYAHRLSLKFAGPAEIPEPPPFERGKVPADVYRRLIRCFNLLRDIAAGSGLRILRLDVSFQDEERMKAIESSDVYDIATLVVSELASLEQKGRRPAANNDEFALFPEGKFPSHVYQHAGVLESQLLEVRAKVEKHPNWWRENGEG